MSGPVESGGIWSVETIEDIDALPADVREVLVTRLDDEKLRALAARPALRTIFSDGNSHATDAGVWAAATLPELERLDLEWSETVTDRALEFLREAPSLRWVDLTGCVRITTAALAVLRAARPDVEIEPPAA